MTSSANRVDTALAARVPGWWLAYVPALIVVAFSLAYQLQQGTTTDVSWLITLSERLLDGRTAYVDFFEVNPPASILLYVPAVAVARLLHVWPEAAVKASAYLGFALDIWLCRRILHGLEAAQYWQGGLPLAVLAAVFLLLPGDVFAQREHFVAIFLLPILSVFVKRAQGLELPPTLAITAGLEAGVVVSVKPYFVVAVALPLVYAIWRRRRSCRKVIAAALAPEQVTIALVGAAYVAAVLLLFPAFATHALPIALDVYGLYTNPLIAFLYGTNALMWASCVVLTVLAAPRKALEAPIAVPLLGSLGCLAAMMLQGRYFDYHAYPSVALALATLALTAWGAWRTMSTEPRGAILPPAWSSLLALAIFVRAVVWFAAPIRDDRLLAALSRLSSHPRIMTVSMGHGLGHPLARRIGGTFVGRLNSPWMYFLIKRALRDPSLPPERRRALRGYIDLEKTVVGEDIVRERPDFILVARDFDSDEKTAGWPYIEENWIRSTPSLLAAFAGYRPVETVAGVSIWARKTAE